MATYDRATLEALRDEGVLSQSEYEQYAGIGGFSKNQGIGVTVCNSVSEFEEYLKDDFSPKTVEGYKQDIRNFFEFLLDVDGFNQIRSDVALPEIPRSEVARWFFKLASGNYSYASIRRGKNSLMKFFQFVADQYGRVVPSIENVKIPKEDSGSPEFDVLRDEEIRGIAEHASNARDKAIILLMYETGMRRQELIDTRKSDVYLEEGYVAIRDTDGNNERRGHFSEEAKKALKEYLAEWESEVRNINYNRQVKADSRRPFVELKVSEYLFQTARSPQVSYSTIFKAVRDASFEYFFNTVQNDGCEDVTAKQVAEERSNKINTETLRHSRRVFYFSEGYEWHKVKALMGDENRNSYNRYWQLAQKIYPEKFKTNTQ